MLQLNPILNQFKFSLEREFNPPTSWLCPVRLHCVTMFLLVDSKKTTNWCKFKNKCRENKNWWRTGFYCGILHEMNEKHKQIDLNWGENGGYCVAINYKVWYDLSTQKVIAFPFFLRILSYYWVRGRGLSRGWLCPWLLSRDQNISYINNFWPRVWLEGM